jgi:hypothetical protein
MSQAARVAAAMATFRIVVASLGRKLTYAAAPMVPPHTRKIAIVARHCFQFRDGTAGM